MANTMNIGDWIVLPSKLKSAFHFGETKGEYEFLLRPRTYIVIAGK